MLTARLHHVQWLSTHGLHRLGYREWGDPSNPNVLLCVHGLTRSSADFSALAQSLSDHYRVVAADMPGRGESDWLPDPSLYAVPHYVNACVALVARLKAESLDWLGTSMGGLIGMAYASLPNAPIRKLVLNDVGPTLSLPALQRIGDYVGKSPSFASLQEARNYIKAISLPFGPHSEEQWIGLCDSVLVKRNNQWTTHYDPAIAASFANINQDMVNQMQAGLWQAYDRIECETLLVRGAQSDLLSHETAIEMSQRGPRARVMELPGVGHAPTFIQDEQIQIVRDFLL